ncbi:MAG: hypothetical protein Cons2KO_00710 [Congregibacter sp.]
MQTKPAPSIDLVFVGGGHAHALVLRQLAMQGLGHLRVTLISPDAFTPYSGMLPGLLAGHYTFEDAHIDLLRLCQWAGVRFYADTVLSLDPVAGTLNCRERGEVRYDFLSIDIGSQPEMDSVPGAREHAIPVKPVAGLWERWTKLAEQGIDPQQRLAIVGGGAGSVEIALAVSHYLSCESAQPRVTLYCGGDTILAGYAASTRRAVERQMTACGVELKCGYRVASVEASKLISADGSRESFDTLIWCTGAAAAPWIAQSGLPCDERGFMQVTDTLQSTGFENVFAAGDIATQVNHPRPKAGVYAVRQGPVLAQNLVAASRGLPLKTHTPQQQFLSMLALGEQKAVAERNGFSVPGAWVWRWKDRIDREFMTRFSDLPERRMPANASSDAPEQAPCGGCGAKVGARSLANVLAEIRERYPQLTPAADDLDDVVQPGDVNGLVQSLDALRALVDDPWRMGRIATTHALSDVYASGAAPHSALLQVTLPFASDKLLERDLTQLLSGVMSVLSTCGCRLLGGHSMQGAEFQLGVLVNGELNGLPMLTKRGAKVGDQLILTKALGVGALFAAAMQNRADGRDVSQALAAMEQSNARAAEIAREHAATALTDVTGFGLAGHLLEMLDETVAAAVSVQALAALPGALEAMQAGVFSTLHQPNRASAAASLPDGVGKGADLAAEFPVETQLLFDPQTSGGLLMTLPAPHTQAALHAFKSDGYGRAAIIGEIVPASASQPAIRLQELSRKAGA